MIITAEKKSLLLYYDYKAHFDFLTDEQLGKIVRSMLNYEIDGVLPEFDETIMKMTFSFIRSNLDRDREKWVKTCKTNKENGGKGGRPPSRPPKNQSGEQVDTTEEQEQNNTTNTEYSSQTLDDNTAELKRNFISNFGNI